MRHGPLPPKIDVRKASELLRQLRAMAPHYTREWPARDDTDPGVALLKIFSSIAEGVISRLNRAPDRNFLAFLDMLGIRQHPGTPAFAPVRFTLAPGTTEPVLIPVRTQVAAGATALHPVLPFETTENLFAIPAALAALLATDPATDRIYKPPPKFLGLTIAATDLSPLTVKAFSASDSKVLQLDPPGQIQEGDFLRIDSTLVRSRAADDCVPLTVEQNKVSDHLIAASVKGALVTVEDPLVRDYAEGTQVRSVTRFELFEGKNFQEHVLFLGHAEYFAIKSEAQIELSVDRAPGASANLLPFHIAWEFFGVTDNPKTEDGWHPLEVDLDGTVGFSRAGRIILIKPAGEIKEKEINGCKSRWIRARLIDPLPATTPVTLPRIESVNLVLSSRGTLLADQAFNNDTPLALNTPFNPFGPEPRVFDRFYLASTEGFSKPDAQVKLNVTLDVGDLLAAPAAIYQGDRLHAFARAAVGGLVEFRIDPITSRAQPWKQGSPPNTKLVTGSVPAVVADLANRTIGVFVRAQEQTGAKAEKIYLKITSGTAASETWFDLQAPAGKIKYDVAAALVNGEWHVLAVADGQLFSRRVNTSGTVLTDWAPFPDPQETLDSAPTAVVVGTSTLTALTESLWVVVVNSDGGTMLYRNGAWNTLTPQMLSGDETFLAAKGNRPAAITFKNNLEVRVFVVNKGGELVMFESDGNGRNLHKDTSPLTSSPSVASLGDGQSERVFVRGAKNRLCEYDGTLDKWTEYASPSDLSFNGGPFAVKYRAGSGADERGFISVLCASDKNSLLEYRAAGDEVNSGSLQAGPRNILLLQAPFGTADFVQIVSGPGAGEGPDSVRKIRQELSSGRFVVLEKFVIEGKSLGLLDAAPEQTATHYRVFEERGSGLCQDALDDQLTIETTTVPEEHWFVFADGQMREIESVNFNSEGGFTGVITISRDWSDPPDDGEPYVLLESVAADTADADSGDRAVLDPSASGDNDAYNDQYLQIAAGDQGETRRITDYSGSNKRVRVDQDFSASVEGGQPYKITRSDLPEGWRIYQDPDQTDLRPELSWEYWNGKGWVTLSVTQDTTEKFLHTGVIEFKLPADISSTEVVGQENFWIRARIIGGDYGRELFTVDDAGRVTVEKDPIRPPLINQLTINYALTEPKAPQYCVTFNNLNYVDQTAANIAPDKYFLPYEPLADTNKALYFGFNNGFKSGPVRIYFAAEELAVADNNRPKLAWEFASNNAWAKLPAEDRTEAFTRADTVALTVPVGFQNTQQLGQALYWIRATLSDGDWPTSPLFSGVFTNTAEAIQARTISDEILGSSNALESQSFQFQQVPVLPGEEVRVREALTEEERNNLIDAEGADAVFEVRDLHDLVIETWVRWQEVQEFFDSTPASRHYRLDRATGEIEFGDNIHGRIPPAGGDNIKAFSYQSGGGVAGNVAAGEINSPVTAVAGVDKVINPMPAGGGSDKATPENVLDSGPAQISNRGRAVTVDDFERLTFEASREVAKVRCVPNRNASGRFEVGWTSVFIVPKTEDSKPTASLELRRAVRRYLAQRADLTIVDQQHIFVGPPQYVPISIDVTVYAKSFDVVATAESAVRQSLEKFLHPLTGGFTGEGWEFGRDLAASDVYRLLEDIEAVDHVEQLKISTGDFETIEIGDDALVASGEHLIRMAVASGE